MEQLDEIVRSQLNISPITQKAISKQGLGRINFRDSKLNYPNSLLLSFTVASSQDQAHHFTNNGGPIGFLGGYRVKIQFDNIGNLCPPNLLSLPLSQQIVYIKDIFDKADIRVLCDCGASYWQGNWEDLDKQPPDASQQPFSGQPGNGIWSAKHNTPNRICKHEHHVLENLESYIPKILKTLNKGSSLSSAESTVQQEPLQAPEQPAGTPSEPEQGTPKSTTINAEKAEPTVEKDIEEVESTSENLDLPKIDTSNVKAKDHEEESDVVSGAEKAEPPVEEITVAKKTPEEELEDEELPKVQESFLSILKESTLRELEIKSPEEYKLAKEYWATGAYLYVTFEEFKDSKKKEKKKEILQEAIYYSCHTEELEKLDEMKRIEILKALALAGLVAGIGAANMKYADYIGQKEKAPIEELINYDKEELIDFIDDQELYADYKNKEYAPIIELYRGSLRPEFIEAVLEAESRYGENMKFDNNGWGIMQISRITLRDYNERTGHHYSQQDLSDDEINIKIGCWYLNWCEKYAKKRGLDPSEDDLYIMYNCGAFGGLKYRKYYLAGICPKTGDSYNALNNFRQFLPRV